MTIERNDKIKTDPKSRFQSLALKLTMAGRRREEEEVIGVVTGQCNSIHY